MTTKTFEGLVVNGQLTHGESLAPFEGQRVVVTLIAPNGRNGVNPPAEVEAEPPGDLDIEMDILFEMPVPRERLADVKIVDGGEGEPILIFPEELPDE